MSSSGEGTQPANIGANQAQVLIVENDRAIRSFYMDLAEVEEIPILTARDPLEAEALIGSTPLTISDGQMPNGGVWALARMMKKAREAGKEPGALVVVTADPDLVGQLRDNPDTALEYPVAGVLEKPVILDMLLSLIHQYISAQQER